MFRAVRRTARILGYDITPAHPSGADCIDLMTRLRARLRGLRGEEAEFLRFCLAHLPASRADLLQDLFVLHETQCMRGGRFVEFGAADGVAGSNSFLLESDYGWEGLLAEPARSWQADLRANRQCRLDHRCVTDRSGETVLFRDCTERALSTIDSCANNDRYGALRRRGHVYPVETVSLNDLLEQHGYDSIDYLSVDTEGSELMLLQAFDFARFRPRTITVEHVHEPVRRAALFDLMTRHGYRRKYETLSQFDDWYARL